MTGKASNSDQSYSCISQNLSDSLNYSLNAGKNHSEDLYEVVEFILARNLYAINLFEVKEVVNYLRITRLPNSPSYVKGIIDLRGEITTIIDLRTHLSISSGDELSEEESKIIILDERRSHSKIGIMVDEVLSVSTYHKNQVDSTATSAEDRSNIIGIIRKVTGTSEKEEQKLVILLDIHQLINAIEKR